MTTAGWRGFTLPGHDLVAPRDATVVAKLKAAGAIIVGVTNMPDFAASDTTRSTAYGRTGNAYDVRFSPGGSSGGTVTAVTADMAVLGTDTDTDTDTGNSIRMPAATSNLVGVSSTRGLVSIAGIVPMDALLDNAGPIARSAADAAVALTVMAGEDPLDPATLGSAAKAQPGPYTRYLVPGALRGRRFGVPAFIMEGRSHVFQGVCPGTPPAIAAKAAAESGVPLRPATRAAFVKALDELRAAGATIVSTPDVFPASALADASATCTTPYLKAGQDRFLAAFGTPEIAGVDAYAAAVGSPMPANVVGTPGSATYDGLPMPPQKHLSTDLAAERTYLAPRRAFLARYLAELDRLHFDGFVYPAIQMPPVDETMPQDGQVSGGPHSDTAWVNVIGVPAVSVPAGLYADGLPFGIEFSARPWRDGDLLGWAHDYERRTGIVGRPCWSKPGSCPTRPHGSTRPNATDRNHGERSSLMIVRDGRAGVEAWTWRWWGWGRWASAWRGAW